MLKYSYEHNLYVKVGDYSTIVVVWWMVRLGVERWMPFEILLKSLSVSSPFWIKNV